METEWIKQDREINAAYSDGSLEYDLPTGLCIQRTIVEPVGDFEVAEIFFKFPRANRRIPILDHFMPVYRILREPAVFVIPYCICYHPTLGLNLTQFVTGDAKLGFSVSYGLGFSVSYGLGSRLILHHETCRQPE